METDNTSDPYTDSQLSPQEARRLFTYTRQAFARLRAPNIWALFEFKRTLQEHGQYSNEIVLDQLFERLSARFTRPVLRQAGIYMDSQDRSINHWNSPIRMGFALFVLDLPLDEFLSRTTLCGIPGRPSAQSVIDRVYDLAPAAAKKMAGQFRQITIWSLADCLSDQMGAGFMSNCACLPKVRDVLGKHTENGLIYGKRAIQLMRECPESFIEHPTFDGAMCSFRLDRLLAERADLRRHALRAFRASAYWR